MYACMYVCMYVCMYREREIHMHTYYDIYTCLLYIGDMLLWCMYVNFVDLTTGPVCAPLGFKSPCCLFSSLFYLVMLRTCSVREGGLKCMGSLLDKYCKLRPIDLHLALACSPCVWIPMECGH